MRGRDTFGTGQDDRSQALLLATQNSGRPEVRPEGRTSLLGIPRFDWSVTLVGFCLFTFVIVSFRVDLAQVGIAIGSIGLVFGKDRLRVPFPVWLYAVFVFWAFLASFASPYPEIAREQLVERLKLLVVMLIAVNALRTEGQLRFYLLFFLACFILFPVRGALFNYFLHGYTIVGRALWISGYGNPNDLACLSLLALGVGLGFRMSEPSRKLVRTGAGIAVILLFVVILLTQSRGGFLGFAVAVLPLIKTLKKTPRRTIGIVVALLIIGFSVPEAVWERLSGIKQLTSTSTIHEADPEGSAAARFEIQKAAWSIFLDHPVFGVGMGAYEIVNAIYAPEIGRKDTHNTYLNLAAELGLPGLLLWCALVGSVLLFAYRRHRDSERKEFAEQQRWMWWGFIGYLVAGIFGSFAALTFPYLMLAILWCSANLLEEGAERVGSRRGKQNG